MKIESFLSWRALRGVGSSVFVSHSCILISTVATCRDVNWLDDEQLIHPNLVLACSCKFGGQKMAFHFSIFFLGTFRHSCQLWVHVTACTTRMTVWWCCETASTTRSHVCRAWGRENWVPELSSAVSPFETHCSSSIGLVLGCLHDFKCVCTSKDAISQLL